MTEWRNELLKDMINAMYKVENMQCSKLLVMARAALAVAEPVIREQADIALRAELAAVTERMSKLDFERTAAELERDALREENARLREALKPFADVAEQVGDEDARWAVPSAYLRAAAAAILGKVKDEAACPAPDEAP